MIIRISKILLVAAVAFYVLLTAFSNINDYHTNLPAVRQVLTMEEVFPHSMIMYRAIINPVVHHMAYIFIIVMECITALICLIGLWKLCRAVKQPAMIFNRAKSTAVAGLTIGFLTWQVIFMSVGGEWFGMWMSPQFNTAIQASFRIFSTILLILIYLIQKDEELSGQVEE